MADAKPIFTPNQLSELIDAYFVDAKNKKEPFCITGVALALNVWRQRLYEWEKLPAYTDTIKRARAMCENYAERRLFTTTPTGAIFALKQYGWKDRQDVTSNDEAVSGVVYLPVKDGLEAPKKTD